MTEGMAARDVAAFLHALKITRPMHIAGQTLNHSKIIDAYEYGCTVEQAHGGADRAPEMPKLDARLSMARRVERYVLAGKPPDLAPIAEWNTTGQRASAEQRHALSAMGSREGKRAARRWVTDPDGSYPQGRRATLAATTQRRSLEAAALEAKVEAFILEARVAGRPDPRTKTLAKEPEVSRSTIKTIRKRLGLQARRGRPSKAENLSR